jgi:hypothetical protein
MWRTHERVIASVGIETLSVNLTVKVRGPQGRELSTAESRPHHIRSGVDSHERTQP